MRWYESTRVPDTVPAPDQERKLELFKFDSCPYCMRVAMALRRMPEVEVELHDVRRDREAARRLYEVTGSTQVPCLFVDGQPLFESEDIVRWLQAYEQWLESSGRVL